MIVMDAVVDKLKLLDYEAGLLKPHGLPPLPRGYFTIAAREVGQGQFHFLFILVCWLLQISVVPDHGLWSLVPSPSSSDSDDLAAASALLEDLHRLGPPLSAHAQISPNKLRTAVGGEIC